LGYAQSGSEGLWEGFRGIIKLPLLDAPRFKGQLRGMILSNHMSKELKKHLRIINKNFATLQHSYNVKKIGVFGSVARGESTSRSDIDILVELRKPMGFFRFIQLEDHLSELLNKKVDLVTRNALKSATKKSILHDVVYATKES